MLLILHSNSDTDPYTSGRKTMKGVRANGIFGKDLKSTMIEETK